MINIVEQEMQKLLRKPGKRFLKYDKRQQAIVSVCNPVVCEDPHEKLEIRLKRQELEAK